MEEELLNKIKNYEEEIKSLKEKLETYYANGLGFISSPASRRIHDL